MFRCEAAPLAIRIVAWKKRASARVVLHLTVGADPIAGMVTVDRGRRCSFCGWLELMTVIDDASGRSPTVPQEPACERQYDNYRRRR